ncbi:septal ring lytic transglycosylase RlpA family protein [Streptomyces sp. M19]
MNTTPHAHVSGWRGGCRRRRAVHPRADSRRLRLGRARGGPGRAHTLDTCWATHYGAEIPPGSYTASGEIFDVNAMAAATSLSLDPQLPFGTQVKVTNVDTGASVTVRINDRGTFTSPTCIDLTDGAFSQIAALTPDPGHITVTEEIVG